MNRFIGLIIMVVAVACSCWSSDWLALSLPRAEAEFKPIRNVSRCYRRSTGY
jgi:hypothetical protein